MVSTAARSGAGLRELSIELGVSTESLRRWSMIEEDSDATALRPVEVVAAIASAARCGPMIRIVTPRGYRIGGLAIEDVIEILRVLG